MDQVFGPERKPKENYTFLVYMLANQHEDLAKKSAKTIKTFVKDIFYRSVTVEQVRRARIKVKKMRCAHFKNHQLLEEMALHF